VRIHVDGFATVTPAGSYRNGDPYAFALKLFGTRSRLRHAPNGAIGNDTFYRSAIGMTQLRAQQTSHAFCQIHGLFFQRLAHTTLPSIYYRTYADFRNDPF
jgi:hypothetical protein